MKQQELIWLLNYMKIKGVDSIMATKFQATFRCNADDGTPIRVETSFVGDINITPKPNYYGYSYFARPTEYSFEVSGTCLPEEDGSFAKIYIEKNETQAPIPEKVIFNNPATVVYWKDGTKTVVKAYDEYFDEEKGLAMAFVKKIHGNKGNYNDVFRKWIER